MKKLLILACLGAAVSFTACKSDSPGPIVINDGQTLDALFQQLKSTPQVFTVTAGTSQQVTGTGGTVLTFNPQSFKDANGNIITGGTVKIELIELYKPGQMIANRVTTTTLAQKALSSGGSVNIKATMNGQEVFAKSYGIAFKQPDMNLSPMSLFPGTVVTDSSGSSVKWSDESYGTVDRTEKDSTGNTYAYLFDSCTNFSWINCDHFYTAPDPKTDVTVVFPDNSYTYKNTLVYVIFPGINSVTCMYAYNTGTHSVSFGYPGYYLPVGSTIKIVVIGSKGSNDYYMDVLQNQVVTSGMTVNVTPASQSLSNIQTALSGL